MVRRIISLILVLSLSCAFNLFAEDILRLATTTSTYETGLLDYIFAPFEKKYKVKVHIISVGTGKAIKLGENGDVDAILVHARQAEDKFVKEGFGVNRRDVMYNDFLILGPKDDLAEISIQDSIEGALKAILNSKCIFISRGDNSGTDKKEKHLWKESGLEPKGKWYLETGQGMSATLLMADEKNAYVLVDRATYLANQNNLRLKKLFEGGKSLFNPYGVIAVSPYKHGHIKYELAMKLIAWLTTPKCQAMIERYKKNTKQLFYSNVLGKVK